ncbi:hypothetical protein ACE1TF_10295 [Geomicrobium sp. JSM 1781026]|uniref:hypothetical protein n=1 Tax=Geomicrobium sp. JSM 1781026 TaxID=3344580 RepID=UPI0035C1C598
MKIRNLSIEGGGNPINEYGFKSTHSFNFTVVPGDNNCLEPVNVEVVTQSEYDFLKAKYTYNIIQTNNWSVLTADAKASFIKLHLERYLESKIDSYRKIAKERSTQK